MKLKKILSLLLVMAMIFSCVGITAMAEESVTVAEVGNTEYTSAAEVNGVGYETLQAAEDAAKDGDTIVLLTDIELNDKVTFFNKASERKVTLDMNGKTINLNENWDSTNNPCAFWVCDGLTITGNGTINAALEGEAGAYAIIVGHRTAGTTDGSVGTLVIEDGTFYSDDASVISVTNGSVTIKDGTFEAAGDMDLNCIDDMYVAGKASIVVNGGTFANFNPENNAAEGTGTNFCAEGYAALPDLNGNYVVGVKPTATVNNLGVQTIPAGQYGVWNGSSYTGASTEDMPLSFVMQFLADQDAEDMKTSPYSEWYADFVITFEGIENESFIADGCYLAGFYGDFGWVKVPVDGMKIEDGVRYPVMLGVGLGQKYYYVCSGVQDFKCALYLTPEILAANPNLKVNLELAVVDNSKGEDAAASALGEGKDSYKVVDYEYDVDDFVVEYVASIGEKKYTSLQSAIAAANAGDTITLLDDIELEEGITIPTDKTITLDLAGKTIKGTPVEAKAFAVINNKGNLTINDTIGEGKIVCDHKLAGSTSYAVNTITNAGTLTIKGGVIENTSTATNQIGYAIDNNSTTGNAFVTVDGGEIKASGSNYYDGIRQFCNSTTLENSVVVKTGSVSSIWMQNPSDGSSDRNTKDVKGSIAVEGGNVNNIYLEPSKEFTASITNGEIGSLTYFEQSEGRDLVGFVSGGTFSVKPDDAYAAEGFEFKANNEGKYEVTEKEEVELFEFQTTTVSLDTSLTINFYVKRDYIESEDYYAVIEHDTADGTTKNVEIPYKNWGTKTDGYYTISYDLFAVQMADEIRVTIYNGNDIQVSEEKIDGIRAYAIRGFNKFTDTTLLTALADMLNYGAAAQIKFNYNVNDLATYGAENFIAQYASQEIAVENIQKKGDNYLTTTLSLENNILLTGYFRMSDITGKYATIEYVDIYNRPHKTMVTSDKFVVNSATIYGVCVDDLAIADAGCAITITVYNQDGTVYGSLVDSMNSYLYRIMQKDDSDIYKMVAKFTSSAAKTLN